MNKKLFSVVSVATFAIVLAFNINASVNSKKVEMDIRLSKIEALVMGECYASASGCSASCSGNSWCTSGSTHVACDGTFHYCSPTY